MVTDSLRYWVDGDARRRLPLRSRHDPGARSRTASTTQSGFLKAVGQDPVLGTRQADRRALGLRAGRLSGRRFPSGLGGMERQVPRHRARLLARRRARRQALAPRLCASRRYLQSSRPAALGQRQLHHRARRLHAQRPRHLQRKAQRGERRGQPRRRLRTTAPGTAASKGPTDDAEINALRRAADAQHSGDAAALARHADDAGRRRVRAHAAGQQQCLLPGQRDQLGRLERGRQRRRR